MSHLVEREQFQSTLPVKGATPGSDYVQLPIPVSIHAPREGSDFTGSGTTMVAAQFQSTLPVKGATLIEYDMQATKTFQSTLPVKGATSRSALLSRCR